MNYFFDYLSQYWPTVVVPFAAWVIARQYKRREGDEFARLLRRRASIKSTKKENARDSKTWTDERVAIGRVANAAREVHAASSALAAYFEAANSTAPPQLQLVRLAAAMGELQTARAAFDALLAQNRSAE